jgi:hypothetical protein
VSRRNLRHLRLAERDLDFLVETASPEVADKGRLQYGQSRVSPYSGNRQGIKKKVRKAWLEFYSLRALIHRLGLSLGKIPLFIWLVNLALCFHTRKKLKWNWKARY